MSGCGFEGGGLGGTDAAEKVFLEVELASTWPLCFKDFEDLEQSVRLQLGSPKLSALPSQLLQPPVILVSSLALLSRQELHAPPGRSDHRQRLQCCR